MPKPPKDKRNAVLERIKALREGRAAGDRPDRDVDAAGVPKGSKRAAKHGEPRHRPQGG